MYESKYSHLANPQLESQLKKSLDQGLLCTNPVPVGLAPSPTHCLIHVFIPLSTYSVMYSFTHPSRYPLPPPRDASFIIHSLCQSSIHSFTLSFPQPPMPPFTLVPFTHFTDTH